MNEGKIIGLTDQGNVVETPGRAFEQVIREGIPQLLADALDLEVSEYLEPCGHLAGPDGRRLVRRNGTLPERDLVTGIGPIRVKQPRVRDGREGHKFTSAILPPYVRRAASVDALLPWLYLKGVSTGDFSEALQAILGPRAKGLSASNVVRLKDIWRKNHKAWEGRDLSGKRYVYWWVDGIYFNVRLEKDRCCLLVVIGATEDGRKELVAVWDGQRESKLSWLTVLRDLKKRGLTEGPRMAVGDGAMGFWAALAEEYPESGEQRCWVHETANILEKMPKSVQPDAERAIHEM